MTTYNYYQQSPLDVAVATRTRSGWNVTSLTPTQATLEKPGKKASHLFHLVMTVLTIGFWLPVWFLASLGERKRKTMVLTMLPDGTIKHGYGAGTGLRRLA